MVQRPRRTLQMLCCVLDAEPHLRARPQRDAQDLANELPMQAVAQQGQAAREGDQQVDQLLRRQRIQAARHPRLEARHLLHHPEGQRQRPFARVGRGWVQAGAGAGADRQRMHSKGGGGETHSEYAVASFPDAFMSRAS